MRNTVVAGRDIAVILMKGQNSRWEGLVVWPVARSGGAGLMPIPEKCVMGTLASTLHTYISLLCLLKLFHVFYSMPLLHKQGFTTIYNANLLPFWCLWAAAYLRKALWFKYFQECPEILNTFRNFLRLFLKTGGSQKRSYCSRCRSISEVLYILPTPSAELDMWDMSCLDTS